MNWYGGSVGIARMGPYATQALAWRALEANKESQARDEKQWRKEVNAMIAQGVPPVLLPKRPRLGKHVEGAYVWCEEAV